MKQKTPITYYGGKQKIAKWIVSQFPPHKSYIEPFAGGLAVFFERQKRAKTDVINDINSDVYNLYLQWKENPEELLRVLRATPYSLQDYKHCQSVYAGKTKASDIERARAFFVNTNSSFGSRINSSWGRRYSGNIQTKPIEFQNSVAIFRAFLGRMKDVYIENRDATKVIKSWDNKDALFYVDPPYPDSDQGHYSGYGMADFNNLLTVLKNIKGKFILSCYKKEAMDIDPKWLHRTKQTVLRATTVANKKRPKRKESIFLNYTP